ncbi:MAG: DUF2971 domain-containing protein [Nitrosomonas sp.]|nr:DUF2971 domain-containing protein [Nitrosomonas sp.]
MPERIEKNDFAELKRQLESSRYKHSDAITPEKLFHYTDARGILGILGSQKLWATHVHYLNDTAEIRHTQELIEESYFSLIEQARPDEKAKLDSNNPLWIYRDFLHYIRYRTARVRMDSDFFVTCFCTKDDLLSQWRGYGNGGFGYAVGFDTGRLKYPCNGFELCKVIYSKEKQKQIIDEILETVTISLKKMTKTMNVDRAESIIETHAHIFEEEVAKYSVFFKHSSFSEEDEWRLVYLPVEGTIKYRAGRLGITPYIEIDLPDGKNNVASIRIGPTVQPELARKALDMLATGYQHIEILSSDIPLR